MFIQTNDDNDIIQLIIVGEKPSINAHEIDNIDEDILTNLSNYKYIDGKFVLKENLDNEKLEKIKKIKIKKMSSICNKSIENGITFNSSEYSLGVYDQIMISELRRMAINGDIVKYHANNCECRVYSAEEFITLADTAAAYIDFHRTYFNKLKHDINDMTDINEVINVQYGQKLSENRNNEFIVLMNGISFDFIQMEDTIDYNRLFDDINIDDLVFPTDDESENINVEETSDETEIDSGE